MVLLHIIIKEPAQVKEIVELLIEERLITGVTVTETISSFKNSKGEIETVLTNMLIGRTKGLLFSTIDKLLREKCGDKMPVLYAMPVVNMDWEQGEKLIKEIK
ncbi:MAG: divalent cation tolerance protein CutA [Bacteroidota bacterium]